MADRNLVYSYNGKNKYDYESRNEEFNDKCDKIKDEEEAEANVHGCINTIIIEPVVEINADIKGLATSVKAVEMDGKMADKTLKHDYDINNELEGNSDASKGVNCIVVKPIIKVDVDISDLNTDTLLS